MGKRSPLRGCKELTVSGLVLRVAPALVAIVLAAATAAALTLWLREPAYWQHHQHRLTTIPVEQLREQARAAEAAFATWLMGSAVADADGGKTEAVLDRLAIALSGGRPLVVEGGEPRTIELSADEINAWLATNGLIWLERHGLHVGGRVRDPMIAFEDGQAVIAFEFNGAGVGIVVSLLVEVSVQEQGRLHMKLAGVRGGSLGVASGSVADPLRMLEDGLDAQQAGWLRQLRQGLVVEAGKALEAADPAQRVVLQSLEIHDQDIAARLAGAPR